MTSDPKWKALTKGTVMQDIGNARSEKQAEDMRNLADAGACLFCPEGLKRVNKRVLYQGEHWYVTPNDFPYNGTSVHVMIVPTRHVLGLTDLTEAELLELPRMITWVNKEMDIKGGSMFGRYGDTTYSAATIHHFHLHIAQGSQKTENSVLVLAPIGYRQPDNERNCP